MPFEELKEEKMSKEKLKNIGELIEYLKKFDPKIEFVCRDTDDPFRFKICTWAPDISRMVSDPYSEKNLMIPFVGYNIEDIVKVLLIGP